MSPLVSFVNQMLSTLTVLGQLLVLICIAYLLLRKNPFSPALAQKALWFAFLVALIATAGSLFYSEIAGFEPCKLCWFQRIFMYPQVLLLGMAIWKKERAIADYGILLAVLGALVAGYHYLLQLGIAPNLPCSAVGYSAACSQVFVMNFGYITIPLMSFTAFLLIVIALWKSRIKNYIA